MFDNIEAKQKTMLIRPIEQRDNGAIASIIRSVLTEFNAAKQGTVYYDPTTDDLFQLFQQNNSAYFIAEGNGKVVGCCGIYPTEGLPKGCCELVKLYLLPEARKAGVGKRLIECCIAVAKTFGYTKMYLESMPELSKAVSLYERLGFTHLPTALGDSQHFGCSVWMMKELTLL